MQLHFHNSLGDSILIVKSHRTYIDNAVHGSTNIGRMHGLTLRLAIIRQRNDRHSGACCANIVQELVFMTKHIGRTNDNLNNMKQQNESMIRIIKMLGNADN
jgi:hypothetical protein